MSESAIYHPDPTTNAEVRRDALEAERLDLAAGYQPRWWLCDCGASHRRGHFLSIGVHRCMNCGYVGEGGTTHTNPPALLAERRAGTAPIDVDVLARAILASVHYEPDTSRFVLYEDDGPEELARRIAADYARLASERTDR